MSVLQDAAESGKIEPGQQPVEQATTDQQLGNQIAEVAQYLSWLVINPRLT